MVAINPEMLRELLAEFTEKEAVNREEINVINQQLEELGKRVTSNKTKLEGLAKDREKILAMQERYLSGKWKTSGKVFTASLQSSAEVVASVAPSPSAPPAPKPEPVVLTAPALPLATPTPMPAPAPTVAAVPAALPEAPAVVVEAVPAPIEAAPVQVNVPSYQPPSTVSTGEVPVLARELVSPQALVASETAAPLVEAPSFDDPILSSFDGGNQPAVDLDTAFAAPQVEPQPVEPAESGFSWASTAINEEVSAPVSPSPAAAWGEPSAPTSPASPWGEASPAPVVAPSAPGAWGEEPVSHPSLSSSPSPAQDTFANPWGEPVAEAPAVANPWGEPTAAPMPAAEVSANPWGEPTAKPSAAPEVSANPWGEPSAAPEVPQSAASPWGEFGDEEWGQAPAAPSQAADGGWEQASAWGASGDANTNVPSSVPSSPPATNAWAPTPSSQEETSSDAAWGQLPPAGSPQPAAAPANPWGEPSEPAAEPTKSTLAKAADGALISPIRSRRKPAPSFDWGGGDSSQDSGNS